MTASRIAWMLVLSAGISAALSTGCARTPRPAGPAPAAGPDRVQEMRDRFARVNPNVRVGAITGVLADERLAAVGDVNVADFQVGQSLTLIDSNAQTLTIGQIVRITDDSLHVRYRQPATGQREPQVGDMAVRVPM